MSFDNSCAYIFHTTKQQSIALQHGFKDFYADNLELLENKITAQVLGPLVDAEAKAQWVKKI